MQIHDWEPIDKETLIDENPGGFYDGMEPRTRRRVDLDEFPLLNDEGTENVIYNSDGVQVSRREIAIDENEPPCGVLMKLEDIQGLFNPKASTTIIIDDTESSSSSSDQDDPFVRVEAYPLGFLKMAGNIKATGVPHCFYPLLTDINKCVRKNHPPQPLSDDEEDDANCGDDVEDRMDCDSNDHMYSDAGDCTDGDADDSYSRSTFQAVKPVSSQFYNYMTHRVASRAGRHDSQQGSVTAAISGGYATSQKDKSTAKEKQLFCQDGLPSERFHGRITSVKDCPSACRAELVYSIDVRALKDPSGSCAILFSIQTVSRLTPRDCHIRSIFRNIILKLARAWSKEEIRGGIKNYLLVLKPEVRLRRHFSFLVFVFCPSDRFPGLIQVFPALYDWVTYPVTLLIKKLFDSGMKAIQNKVKTCPFQLELIASLERVLCFCHTGSTAVFATSLMNGLGLSKGAIVDGFPMLHHIFDQPTILSALNHGLRVDPRRWPLKDRYPAIASKRAQVLTYSLSHFMVRSTHLCFCHFQRYSWSRA